MRSEDDWYYMGKVMASEGIAIQVKIATCPPREEIRRMIQEHMDHELSDPSLCQDQGVALDALVDGYMAPWSL